MSCIWAKETRSKNKNDLLYLHEKGTATKNVKCRVQSCKVSTVILRDARQPILHCLETRNLASLSQCCETRNLARNLARNDQYFKHHPQYVQIFCKRVHPTILTTYVQTFLPTCKEPYTVSTCHARQGLQDDTMELWEKSGTCLAARLTSRNNS